MNEGLLAGVGTGYTGTRGRFSVDVVESSTAISCPAWAKFVSIIAAGGGGGGGGGRLGFTTVASGGAGGGGGGSRYLYRVPTAFIGTPSYQRFVVTIGAGGTSGTGATSDAANGGAGGTGGATTVLVPNSQQGPGTILSMGSSVNGGSGGGGGTTTIISGGNGGTSNNGNAGLPGSAGNTSGTAVYFAAGSIGAGYNLGPCCSGGMGGTGKSDTVTGYPYRAFGYPFVSSTADSTANGTVGANGIHAYDQCHALVKKAIGDLYRAPFPFELWWTTNAGGFYGAGGTSSGTAVSGGNGGNGWRGSGGGGGGGAGVSGAVGGNGGTGGNGYAIFFWEEY